MPKTTLKTIEETLVTVVQSIDRAEKNLKEHIDTEIHGLAFLVAKTEERLIDRLDKNDIRIGELENKVSGLDVKVDRLEEKTDSLESKTDRIEGKIDLLQKEMKSGFQRLEKTKISYNSPIKVKKSTKAL